MRADLVPPRHGERALRGAKGQRPRKFFYQRLMQVSIRHSYYNDSQEECPDFTVHPTPFSAALMEDLGLLLKDEGTGFSILYDEKRRQSLLEYLKRQGELWEREDSRSPQGPQVWTRLSFVLCLRNPFFVNFTRIPINTNPAERNFYFTNQDAHREPRRGILLQPGERVTGAELVKVVPVQYPFPLSPADQGVLVLDISGEPVLEEPRKSPSVSTLFIDFSGLPEDKYTLEAVSSPPGGLFREEVLYTTLRPMPLCFIDLLFTDPAGGGGKGTFYPVKDLWTRPRIEAVDYQLAFAARSTFWSYFIVPPPAVSFEELHIAVRESPHPVDFAGPCRVRLPNGQHADRFVSKQEIPLQQRSDYNFRLRGRRSNSPHERTVMDRLPVATIEQVLPEDRDSACLRLWRSLRSGARRNPRCRDLVRELCQVSPRAGGEIEEDRGLPGRRSASRRNYSDIYVYV